MKKKWSRWYFGLQYIFTLLEHIAYCISLELLKLLVTQNCKFPTMIKSLHWKLIVEKIWNCHCSILNTEQPGTTHYYSHLNIFSFSCLYHAQVRNKDYKIPMKCMHCNVNNEDIAKREKIIFVPSLWRLSI